MSRKRLPGPAPDFSEPTPSAKERLFARVGVSVERERAAKAKRMAEAEEWIKEVRARKKAAQ